MNPNLPRVDLDKNYFSVNEYISLRLESGATFIYLDGKKFLICKGLFISDPREYSSDEFNSIDAVAESIHNSETHSINITPEQEFWGHCSNLQAWVEHDYDTRLLHSNIAFPLLGALVKLGDKKAQGMFKEEVARRFKDGLFATVGSIIFEGFLGIFTQEELDLLFEDFDFDILVKQNVHYFPELIKNLIDIGRIEAKTRYYEEMIHRLEQGKLGEFMFLLDKSAKFKISNKEERIELLSNINIDELNGKERPFNYYKAMIDLGGSRERENCLNYIKTILNSKNTSQLNLLIRSTLLNSLTEDEINDLFDEFDFNLIQQLPEAPSRLLKLFDLGLEQARTLYESEDFLKQYLTPEAVKNYKHLANHFDNIIRLIFQPSLDRMIPPFAEIIDKKIDTLYFRDCGLKGIDFLPRIDSLQTLLLGKNNLNSLPRNLLEMENLKVLALNDNYFTEIPELILSLDNLEELYMKNNQINTIKNVNELKKRLNKLELAGNPIVS